MNLLLQQLVNGLILGSVYELLALGYTMVYGIIKLINFAHGDIYMMGAFIDYFLINSFQMNFFVALIVAMLATAILRVLIEFLAYRPLCHSISIAVLITAIGISDPIGVCKSLNAWCQHPWLHSSDSNSSI